MTLPSHIAVIMDGNGRWAQKHRKPRHEGHKKGIEAARRIIEDCGNKGIRYLTLFAFSSENWRRPPAEINMLMTLFAETMDGFSKELQKNHVRIRFLGDLGVFPEKLRKTMAETESLTSGNRHLNLGIAVNYGGRWDIANAVRSLAVEGVDLTEVSSERLAARMSTSYAPDPDLLIRTGGEVRVSNFLLWQLAYTELYFSETLWPEFTSEELDQALGEYASRERRFGSVADREARFE